MYVGGCSCGAVRFRCTVEPFWASYCHCSDCRHVTGAPVTVMVGFRDGEVRFDGVPSWRRTSECVHRAHCAECGTPLVYRDDRLPGEVYLMAGAFDDPSFIRPQMHAFVDEALPWLTIADDLPRKKGFTRSR